jgi:hypothetical protein
MKFFVIVLFFGCYFIGQAQEIDINGTIYTVKKEAIFKNGMDVTETLTLEERKEIKANLEEKIRQEKAKEETEKKIEKAEKEQKRAENKQKKAEKALKKREKEHSNFEKSVKKHEDAISKYEKLKRKGKLSPEDEGKWLKKIDKLKEANEKAQRKLQ